MSGAGLSDDDDLLAAELVFGLIDGAEARAAESRLARDDAFAEAHARWQAYAAALFAGEELVPRPSVWSAIAARLPANDSGNDAGQPMVRLTRLRRWQGAALAASLAALVFGGIAWQRPAEVPVAMPPAAPMVAVLTGKQGSFAISFDSATRRISAVPAGLASGLNLGAHSTELWVIPADGKPRSLGLVNASAAGASLPGATAASLMAGGVTLAVSVEPRGGSPTGLPTGPVILTGKLSST